MFFVVYEVVSKTLILPVEDFDSREEAEKFVNDEFGGSLRYEIHEEKEKPDYISI